MHILELPSWYPAYPGDPKGTFFRDQAIALSAYGHEVGVVDVQLQSLRKLTTGRPRRVGLEESNDLGVRTLRVLSANLLPRMAMPMAALWLSQARLCCELYRRRYGTPDLLHAHSLLYGGVLACQLSRSWGVPVAVTEHVSAYARGHYSWSQMQLARWARSRSSLLLAVSASLARDLSQVLGGPVDDWNVVPNLVDDAFLGAALPAPRDADEPFVFCSVAMLTEVKGMEVLLEAFALHLAQHGAALLRIGGDGPSRRALEEQARRLGVSGAVEFLGSLDREQVLDTIRASDALVLSSHYETFGVVVIEALALGRPVIATRCGGPNTTVEDEDGFLVDPNSPEAMAEAMDRMRKDRTRFDASTIRERCRDRFASQRVAGLLTGHFESVVGTAEGALS